MYTLFDILSATAIDLDDFPEKLITDELGKMVDNAKSHKFHKQYEQRDMDKFQQTEIDNQSEKDQKTLKLWQKIIRGLG
jgi:hypothetical protein